jgi:hypothetical protein
MTARKSKRAAKAKAAPRRKAAKPNPANDGLDIADAVNNQIRFAEGLMLAVMGQGDLCAFDSSPIVQLIETHIEGLRSVADSIEKFRGEAVS